MFRHMIRTPYRLLGLLSILLLFPFHPAFTQSTTDQLVIEWEQILNSDISYVDWSPDSQYLAYQLTGTINTVSILHIDTRTSREITLPSQSEEITSVFPVGFETDIYSYYVCKCTKVKCVATFPN